MSSPAPDPLVEIRGLHFRRGERVVFGGVDLDIVRGKVTAIMGPSGTGTDGGGHHPRGGLHPARAGPAGVPDG